MSKHSLEKALSEAKVEKDVENAYRDALKRATGGEINAPWHTDGVLRSVKVDALLEFKWKADFNNPLQQATALVQAIWYLKQIENAGEKLPKAIFIADEDHCFCVATADVVKYTKEDRDWSIAASSAATKNADLVVKIADDKAIMPFVYDVRQRLGFEAAVVKMAKICEGVPYAATVNARNITTVYEIFCKNVFAAKNVSDADKVDVFLTCLVCEENAYLHPKKDNSLVCRGTEYKVDARNFLTFFQTFRQKYTYTEVKAITACKDQIMENVARRRTGAFFTPDLWVDEAHKMISDVYGEDWKEKFVVWDCCAGTGQLTRGYRFKELYLSTLDNADCRIIKDCGYNPEATVFQYDFLSEVELGPDVPEGLKKAFADGKPVLFLINPPYGTAGNLKFDEKKKNDVAKGVLWRKMADDKIGASSQQLYAQFLYRIALLNGNTRLGLFSPPLWMSGHTFKALRSRFCSSFDFRSGMLFQASHFADVSSEWGISFTIWETRK